jgi:ABC-type sugar transport system ATPase subunit
VEVLHGVSFSLRPGEVHALLGENGAGKSTLVKVMTGIHQPDGGEIYLNGERVPFDDTLASRQAGITAIYQALSHIPDLDVAENIFIARQPTHSRGSHRLEDALTARPGGLLDSLGVQLDLKQKRAQPSIAQQQMVEIARAFSVNARILIMD